MNSSDRRMILSDWRKILSTAFCLCYCTPQTPGPYYQLMWGLWILSTRSVWDSCLESNGRLQPSLKWWTIQQTGLTSLSHISYPVDASRYLSMWLDLTTGLHLVVHGTSGSTSYETTPHVRLRALETCCRPWTWWCNDATALAGYGNMMMMMMMMMKYIDSISSNIRNFSLQLDPVLLCGF